jgi:flagellar protein FliO/FliZ
MEIAGAARSGSGKPPARGKGHIMSETVIYAMSIVLLIGVSGLGIWLLRQSLGLDGMPLFSPKQRRIGVVESVAVDGRRRLLLVRRDNVEHLVMIGGPVDVLVETGIPAASRPALIGLEPPPVATQVLNGRDAGVALGDKIPFGSASQAN